jgi:DNA-binding CsgD family transcriptional regulator/GAF domain-containing protein
VVPAGQVVPTHPGSDPAGAGAIEFVRFVEMLVAASNLEQLERRFLAGFGRVMGTEMHGYDLVDPRTERPTRMAAVNVSDTFVARYERTARDVDPLLATAFSTGRAAYNMDLMGAEEWMETEVYRRACRLHDMRHVVIVPVLVAGRIVGHLNFAVSDPTHDFSSNEIRVAESVAHVLGLAIDGIDGHQKAARERDQAQAALDLAGVAIVVADPGAAELRLNETAKILLGEVVDAEERLHRLLARPLSSGGFSHRIEIQLVTGQAGVIHARAAPMPGDNDGLVAVVELEREHPTIAPGSLAHLAPREREVAALVVDGLSDREIAQRLSLSHHTVSQYVKRIYRKLDVDSRVALTRLLLGVNARPTTRSATPRR